MKKYLSNKQTYARRVKNAQQNKKSNQEMEENISEMSKNLQK